MSESASVSCVIPSLDEEKTIAAAVRSALDDGALEVIVSDGGSRDGTAEIARRSGATVVDGARGRGSQLNLGASQARGDVLLFLHADSILPAGSVRAASAAVAEGYRFGGFRLRFLEESAGLRIAQALINFRTSVTRCPWGDQCQFIPRSEFRRIGGFRDIPIMEDYDLALRMRRRGRTALLEGPVLTSGRRFLERGILRTVITNWTLVARFRFGADPETLARIYRRGR